METIDCPRCGGCAELDASGFPCPGCKGKGYVSVKLTTAQSELLSILKEKGEAKCAEAYSPARKLVSLGLAEWGATKYGFGSLRLLNLKS